MNNEIKKILDYLGNDKNYYCNCNDGSYYLVLLYREAHELKDYITTLKKEVRINNDLIPCFKNNEKSLKKQLADLESKGDKI